MGIAEAHYSGNQEHRPVRGESLSGHRVSEMGSCQSGSVAAVRGGVLFVQESIQLGLRYIVGI